MMTHGGGGVFLGVPPEGLSYKSPAGVVDKVAASMATNRAPTPATSGA